MFDNNNSITKHNLSKVLNARWKYPVRVQSHIPLQFAWQRHTATMIKSERTMKFISINTLNFFCAAGESHDIPFHGHAMPFAVCVNHFFFFWRINDYSASLENFIKWMKFTVCVTIRTTRLQTYSHSIMASLQLSVNVVSENFATLFCFHRLVFRVNNNDETIKCTSCDNTTHSLSSAKYVCHCGIDFDCFMVKCVRWIMKTPLKVYATTVLNFCRQINT